MGCLFCGATGPLTREHVAPRWLASVFPDFTDAQYERAFQAAGDALSVHTRSGAPFDQTVKVVCAPCNNGWMSRLEAEMQPMLTPLILDSAGSLDALAQERIAVWATKTILVMGPTNMGGADIVPADMYRWFGTHQAPLPGSLVWLGRYIGTERRPISFHLHGMVIARADDAMPPVGSPTNGFHAVLAIGHLVIAMFFADVPEGPISSGGSDDRRQLIWPTTGLDIFWPPSEPMTRVEQLQRESRRTPNGEAPPLPS